MAQKENLQIVLSERPTADIVLGKTFTQRREPIPKEEDLKDGEVLLETLYVSLEPAMRGWITDARSYTEPVPLNSVMRSFALSRVAASRSSAAKPGDLVTSMTGWQEWAVAGNGAFFPQANLPSGCKPTDLLGALGGTGLTAYIGMLKIGEPKAGDTVVVSAAAGATGSIAGQIAKIKGARVIGIAGGEDKCRWLKEELGFDVVLDYKGENFKAKFKEATPKYVDVYFDNVGGEILEMVLQRANTYARFVMCGAISQYNKPRQEKYKMGSMETIIAQRVKMQGFIVSDYQKEFAAIRKDLAQWISAGKIKRRETIVKGGLAKAEVALKELYNGANTGKMLVEVRNPDEAAKL